MALKLRTGVRVMNDEEEEEKKTQLTGIARLQAMMGESEESEETPVPQPAKEREESKELTGVARLQAMIDGIEAKRAALGI